MEIPKGKVQELINQRNAALEAREYSDERSIITDESFIEKTIEKKIEFPTPLPEEQIKTLPPKDTDLPNIDEIGVIETTEGRRKCPICGNENLRLIREVEDKTKIISAYPRLYGKKLKCGQCGAEWR